jgi:selenocysteine lyase/cysteine desulfurase
MKGNQKTGSGKLTYLNTAAAGLLSPASVSAANAFNESLLANPSESFLHFLHDRLPQLRKKTARLLGTRASQIAFAPNFSFGLLSVISNLAPDLKRVLLYGDDYPSLNMPFELGGFGTHYVRSPDGFSIRMEDIRTIIEREKIQVVAISHVQFLTGFKIDLEELGACCREKEVVLIVDATQSMGAVSLNFDKLPVDVLISSSYKWLNGGYGTAVLCVKEEFIRRFPPRFAGFGSMHVSPEGWAYAPSINSFEPGHLNGPGLVQLEQAVEQRVLDTVAKVEGHNRQLLQNLAAGLGGTSFKVRGGPDSKSRAAILSFEAGKQVHDYLVAKEFAVTWRKGMIRVSPHFYNTAEEIAAFVEALQAYRGPEEPLS